MIELRLQRVDAADLRVAELLQQFESVVQRNEFFTGVAGWRNRTQGTPPFTTDLVDPLAPTHPR